MKKNRNRNRKEIGIEIGRKIISHIVSLVDLNGSIIKIGVTDLAMEKF